MSDCLFEKTPASRLQCIGLLDEAATRKLADALLPILESGVLDDLAKDDTAFHELSYSRLGGFGHPALAREMFGKLKAKGLARETEDGVSIPMHPIARGLVLVLLSQILRPYGAELGLELCPCTDRPELVEALVDLLSLPSLPSKGQVVSFDLETVGVDLARVPMDEVLSFRQEHRKDYTAYARALRRFIPELSQLPEAERTAALDDRQAEIREMANELNDIGKKAWKAPGSFALTIAGAVWTFKTGDPVGALLVAAGAAVGASSRQHRKVDAYSYLFRARELRYA